MAGDRSVMRSAELVRYQLGAGSDLLEGSKPAVGDRMSVENGGIQWVNRPPARRYVPIISVKPGESLTVRAAGTVLGAPAHYFDGRSWPCSALVAKPCPVCKSQPARWKGFLPVYLTSGAKRIVEITEGCFNSNRIFDQFRLLGTWLAFRRRSKLPNSPLLCEEVQWRDRVMPTEPFCPLESVKHMWGLDVPGNVLEVSAGAG